MTTYANESVGEVRRAWVAAVTPWLSRLVLIPPALIMFRVAARFIFDPTRAAAPTGVVLNTPEALTDTRVIGGLALTFALVIMAAFFSRNTRRWGHAIVAVLMALILAIRLFGFRKDGTTLAMGDQSVKVIGEVVFLTLNSLAFAAESYRLKHSGSRP